MEISDNARKTIVDEIKLIVKMMKNTKDPHKILYYFSAIYGILNRMYNIEYNDDLVFAHAVIQMAHQSFMQRVAAMQQGDTTIIISDKHLAKLINLCDSLGKSIQKDKDFSDILKNIVVLSYSIQGNGYFLMEKGELKI